LILPVQLVVMINAKTISEPDRHRRDAGRSHDPLRLGAGRPGWPHTGQSQRAL